MSFMDPRTSAQAAPEPTATAVFLSEERGDLNAGADFLQRLTAEEIAKVRAIGVHKTVPPGQSVFRQGDVHEGIWLIESGTVRAFYVSPSGREITLAIWTRGHFIGGPEIFGGGVHVWSGDVQEEATLLYLTGAKIRTLVETMPNFALGLIEGLVAKGKCYSALVQMLGTRSVTERLAQLLLIFADTSGRPEGNRLVIERKLTHDQLAAIVGATRQWVTMTLDKFQKRGLISVSRQCIVVENYDMLASESRA